MGFCFWFGVVDGKVVNLIDVRDIYHIYFFIYFLMFICLCVGDGFVLFLLLFLLMKNLRVLIWRLYICLCYIGNA